MYIKYNQFYFENKDSPPILVSNHLTNNILKLSDLSTFYKILPCFFGKVACLSDPPDEYQYTSELALSLHPHVRFYRPSAYVSHFHSKWYTYSRMDLCNVYPAPRFKYLFPRFSWDWITSMLELSGREKLAYILWKMFDKELCKYCDMFGNNKMYRFIWKERQIRNSLKHLVIYYVKHFGSEIDHIKVNLLELMS